MAGKRVALGVAGVVVLGGVGLGLLSGRHGLVNGGLINASLAQGAGFHAVTVSATQSGNTGFAWIIGSDGSARFCTNGTGTVTCAPVHY